MGKIKFTIIDLDHGDDQYNITNKYFIFCFIIGDRLWKDYIPSVDSIIFLIDSTNSIGFPEEKKALDVCISFILAWQLFCYFLITQVE